MKTLQICLAASLLMSCATMNKTIEETHNRKVVLLKTTDPSRKPPEYNIFRMIITSKQSTSCKVNFLILEKTASSFGCDKLDKVFVTNKDAEGNCIKFALKGNKL